MWTKRVQPSRSSAKVMPDLSLGRSFRRSSDPGVKMEALDTSHSFKTPRRMSNPECKTPRSFKRLQPESKWAILRHNFKAAVQVESPAVGVPSPAAKSYSRMALEGALVAEGSLVSAAAADQPRRCSLISPTDIHGRCSSTSSIGSLDESVKGRRSSTSSMGSLDESVNQTPTFRRRSSPVNTGSRSSPAGTHNTNTPVRSPAAARRGSRDRSVESLGYDDDARSVASSQDTRHTGPALTPHAHRKYAPQTTGAPSASPIRNQVRMGRRRSSVGVAEPPTIDELVRPALSERRPASQELACLTLSQQSSPKRRGRATVARFPACQAWARGGTVLAERASPPRPAGEWPLGPFAARAVVVPPQNVVRALRL